MRPDSVANASQIATLNKADLEELVRTLPRDIKEVDDGLRWFVSLG